MGRVSLRNHTVPTTCCCVPPVCILGQQRSAQHGLHPGNKRRRRQAANVRCYPHHLLARWSQAEARAARHQRTFEHASAATTRRVARTNMLTRTEQCGPPMGHYGWAATGQLDSGLLVHDMQARRAPLSCPGALDGAQCSPTVSRQHYTLFLHSRAFQAHGGSIEGTTFNTTCCYCCCVTVRKAQKSTCLLACIFY